MWWQNNHLNKDIATTFSWAQLSDCHMWLRHQLPHLTFLLPGLRWTLLVRLFCIFRHWTRCKRWLPCVTQYFALYFLFCSFANLESHSLYSLSFSPQTMMVSAIYTYRVEKRTSAGLQLDRFPASLGSFTSTNKWLDYSLIEIWASKPLYMNHLQVIRLDL